ncbi:hypothetical protein LSM04_000956, partial [Trypanosoma melophagium]|uniref:uncharacterized protein n=1 Tax=Trypanosoma melophagium TaxID=715481 RepID=UPI00351A79E0
MRVNTISVNSDSSGKSWSYLRNKHGTESEEIVLPTLENDRGLIMGGSTEEKQEKRDGVYNSPPARFETGGKIQSMAIEKEVVESEGVTANNNSVTIKRKPSSLEIALAEGPILHAEDVVPRKNMKLMPLVCGNMGNRRNPLARMPFFKENTLIRQHRNALCLNLISQEMECRLEIW